MFINDNDSMAPWNEVTPEKYDCPVCNGCGRIYVAYNIDGDYERVTEAAYRALPDTRGLAEQTGKKWYKGYSERCECCNGTGVVYDEPDSPDDFAEDMLMDRIEA